MLVTGQRLSRPLEQIAPLLAATGKQGAGRLDIGTVDQRPRRQQEGAEALIRFLAKQACHLEHRIAYLQFIPRFGLEQLHHPGGEPDLAGSRGTGRCQSEFAIEGKTVGHRPNGGKLQRITVKQHAVEADGGLHRQAILFRSGQPAIRQRSGSAQHPIRPDKVAARRLESGIEPIRYQRHTQDARNAQGQRQHKPAQLAAETFPAQQSPSQSPLHHPLHLPLDPQLTPLHHIMGHLAIQPTRRHDQLPLTAFGQLMVMGYHH